MTREEAAQFVNKHKTEKGGFSRASLKKLGISYPPTKGWRKSLINSLCLSEPNQYILPTDEERIEDLERKNIELMKRLELLESEVFGVPL